jgi:hypothetical protein
MRRPLRFVYLLLVVTLAVPAEAPAGDLPTLDTLQAIAAKLPRQPQSRGTTFQSSGSGAADPVCNMHRFSMTLATGSPAARSLPVLLDQQPSRADAAVTLLTVLHGVAVDADGSPRSYHPDDPHGTGTCARAVAPDGTDRYSGICALEDFASAHLLIFQGSHKLGKGEFESPWKAIWPLIRDKKLPPFDMKRYVTTAPDGYYFFYWKERSLSVFFKRQIIPQSSDGFPCLRDSGYFVAATTLKQDSDTLPNGCAPSRYINAEQIPFFVLPDDAFGKARAGDIVIGRLARAPSDRVVYGVVGDTGPVAQFGEGSIAFNRALLATSKPIENGHDANTLDISSGPVTILVLGGTKGRLAGDYSPQNIEQVGSSEFARWSGGSPNETRRLDACVRQLVGR